VESLSAFVVLDLATGHPQAHVPRVHSSLNTIRHGPLRQAQIFTSSEFAQNGHSAGRTRRMGTMMSLPDRSQTRRTGGRVHSKIAMISTSVAGCGQALSGVSSTAERRFS
jgi:hypothetical protein